MKMKKKTAVRIIHALDRFLRFMDYASFAILAAGAGCAAYWVWSVR